MYNKPYSASLSVAALIIGLLVTTNSSAERNEFIFIGLLVAAASLFLFLSVKEDNIKFFNIGQFFIYGAYFVLYLLIIVKVPLWVNLLFFLTMYMFHITMRYVKETEFI